MKQIKDDLTIIPWLGKASSEALVSMGIDSFEKLSQVDDEELHDMLEAYGLRINVNMKEAITHWNEEAYLLGRGDE